MSKMIDLHNDENLFRKATEKIVYGESLLQLLNAITNPNIEGIQKLHRKVKQELNFLKRICKSHNVKEEHLQCSNLTHFGALINVLNKKVDNCISVKKSFNLEDHKVNIDIICQDGLTWIKVIARNPKSLSEICLGNSNYGVRTLINQAEDYLECASANPCLFQTPKVIFVFANGVGTHLASSLEKVGISVEGERILNIEDEEEEEEEKEEVNNILIKRQHSLSSENTKNILNVNLDVSTMLAYTSSVTNGSCMKYKFNNHVLAQQAHWEYLRPVKPILDKLFEGKTLYCCETAKNSFLDILKTVGGENEKKRGKELLNRLIILPDDIDNSKAINNYAFNSIQYNLDKNLPLGGKIKERSLKIFKFGDKIQALTVTSNDGFVRAARQQGINFVVFVHESRALTEQKEIKSAIN